MILPDKIPPFYQKSEIKVLVIGARKITYHVGIRYLGISKALCN